MGDELSEPNKVVDGPELWPYYPPSILDFLAPDEPPSDG